MDGGKKEFGRGGKVKLWRGENLTELEENCDECSVKYLHVEDNPSPVWCSPFPYFWRRDCRFLAFQSTMTST